MAEKDVPKVRQERSLFDAFANRRECPHLGRCVRHGRTDSRPSWPSAAAGPADAAPDTTPAALQRGVGRIGVRPIAAVAPVAATACVFLCHAWAGQAAAPLAVRWPRTGAVHLANSHSSHLQI